MKKYFILLLFLSFYVFTQNIEKTETVRNVTPAPNHSEMDNPDVVIPFAAIEQIPLFNECEAVEKAEQMQCFDEQMQLHIKNNFKYPKEAKKNKITGRVAAQFIIDKEGNVIDIKARYNGNSKGNDAKILEDEAIRIIQKLPKFIPGKQRGIPFYVSYAVPIIFKLN